MQLIAHFRDTMNPPVFLGAVAVILVFVIHGTVFTEHAEATFEATQSYIITHFGWFYILAATGLLGFVGWLALSRFGDIRLGGEDAEPNFNGLTWFTMLLAAGMGIGLVFFGVAEPMMHYASPLEAEPETVAARQEAMLYTYFHWGLHPWAIYISIALPLAYFHFRHGLPLAPRSLLYPLIGDRIKGWIGHVVDIVATVGTLFGVGTSLGLGAMQINAGLDALFEVPMSLAVQLMVIAAITATATVSVVTGLSHGIRRLSEFNVGLAGLILLFVVVAGPTVYILEIFTTSLGQYLQNLPRLSLTIDPALGDDWQADWTLFYWSWWIAWCPFVGIFAARISRGRTIRVFVSTMLLVPVVTGFFWFAALGGSAFFIEQFGPGGIIEPTLEDEALSFFALLAQLPWSAITSTAGILLVVVFFVTSSDSGSLVDVMVTSGGHPNPPAVYRIFWCVSEGVVAATLLIAGGLTALRTASLTPALPMTIFLLVACYGLIKALQVDAATEGRPETEALRGESR